MKGTYHVEIRNSKVIFNLDLKRNITIIKGDSATGKSTMVEMVQSFEVEGKNSGVKIRCRKKCRVLSGIDWELRLSVIRDSIVFIDEGNAFLSSREFARAIRGTDNYYVLVTRENLYQLPYSVESVLKLEKTTRRKNKTYTRAYPLYDSVKNLGTELTAISQLVTEDSNSGHDFFACVAKKEGIRCLSAKGKSNIFSVLQSLKTEKTMVVADGAAFGAEMEKVYQLAQQNPGNVLLYLPESFEWILLKSEIFNDKTVREMLNDPGAQIESGTFFSWEQFFAHYLIELTQDTPMRYKKNKLNRAYLQPENIVKIKRAMEGKL